VTARPVSNWMRWGAVVWLAIWVPSYWHTWGAVNFLHLCDIAVLLTCIGLWTSNSLLLSSQAVGSMLSDAAWCLDAGWRLFLGKHLVGGTEYMWDANYSLFTRVLSLFHIVMPVILLVSLRQTGYDRRGWKLQAAITAVLMVASRFFNPALNLNYAFTDPVFHRAWGPVPIHLAAMFAGIVIVFYLPVHLVLDKVYPRPATTS
jgi:hypothetical protein